MQVELYATCVEGDSADRHEMKCVCEMESDPLHKLYIAEVPTSRPLDDYTFRVMPHFQGVEIPLEEIRTRWQL